MKLQALLLSIGLFLSSLGSARAASYHWVPTTPDGSSGSLTIPDTDNDIGGHNLFPAPTGSWTDGVGLIWTPTPVAFIYDIFAGGVLQELGNTWVSGAVSVLHISGSGETTDAFGGGLNIRAYNGRWVQDVTTAVPDGGATVALLGVAVGGLALIRRRISA